MKQDKSRLGLQPPLLQLFADCGAVNPVTILLWHLLITGIGKQFGKGLARFEQGLHD